MSQSPSSYEPYSPGRPGPEEGAVVRREDPHAPRCAGGAPHGMVIASVVCVVIWAMSGFGYFWPVWVLLPTVLLGAGKMKAAASVSGHLRRRGRS